MKSNGKATDKKGTASAGVGHGVVATSKPWPLTDRPGFLIRRLHQIHVNLFAESCGDFEITPLQYSLLSSLAEMGQADQTTLANAVALDRTTTTGALKRLQARGLVTRAVSGSDRRAQICAISGNGKKLLQAIEASARVAHRETLAPLDTDEQKILVQLLRRAVAGHAERQPQASSDA